MKKTSRNQNMPDQDLKRDKSPNPQPFEDSRNLAGKPERFKDANLDQPGKTKQKYDDYTGTVENGIG